MISDFIFILGVISFASLLVIILGFLCLIIWATISGVIEWIKSYWEMISKQKKGW